MERVKKYRFLIGSILIVIFLILIFIPRIPEKLYVIYDIKDNNCNSVPFEISTEKGSYYICDKSKFIHLTKNINKKSRTLNLSKIDNFTIIPKKELLVRFNNELIDREKNDFDLLNRDKKFEFNLIMIDSNLNSFEIIPVNRLIVLSTLNLDKL